MGQGSWDANTYRSYAETTGYKAMRQDEVFSSRNIKQHLDPRHIVLRESCDSQDNPNSTPIIFGLDVTGSMGKYVEEIAKTHLPTLMEQVHDLKPVTDPHVMFMGIGDVRADSAPLQASQFEADLRIIEQLRDLWLERGGGGNDTESYDLPWYFAAHRTALDSVNKRGKKGFLFTFGDEKAPNEELTPELLRRVFGAGGNLPRAGSPKELLAKAREKFQVFHVIIEQGNYARSAGVKRVRDSWTELMGSNVIFLRDSQYLTEVVIATMRIANGEDIDRVIQESSVPEELVYAFNLTGE